MDIIQISEILEAAHYSPEEFGKLVGISGMTIRRWMKKPGKSGIPKVYVAAIRDACYRLISEGRLSPDSPVILALLSDGMSGVYEASLKNLGLSKGFDTGLSGSQEQILSGLVEIGSQSAKQTMVRDSASRLPFFRNLGEEWSRRIGMLWKVISSEDLSSPDKVVAYGALFYLLTPIDFIPDTIPFFGFLDDLGVMGIAVAYYSRRFQNHSSS